MTDASGLRARNCIKNSKDGIFVACGQGVLVLSQVQLEGKKRMDTDAFFEATK